MKNSDPHILLLHMDTDASSRTYVRSKATPVQQYIFTPVMFKRVFVTCAQRFYSFLLAVISSTLSFVT